MTWHLLMKTLTVKDGERALLTRNGRLERVLEPGRHRLFDLRCQLTTEILLGVRQDPLGAGARAPRPGAGGSSDRLTPRAAATNAARL